MKDINWITAFPDRLQKRMDELGLTAVELGHRAHMSNSLIGHYLNGRRPPNIKTLASLEKALDLPPGWFQYPDRILSYGKPSAEQKHYLRTTNLPILHNYDVYNWVRYAKLPDICDYRQTIMDAVISPRSFYLEIEGDSMISDRLPHISLTPGDLVIVTPELKPEVGCLVVIKTKDGDVKVREYQKDGKQVVFKALDPRYPLLVFDGSIEILGVLISRITKLKHSALIHTNSSTP